MSAIPIPLSQVLRLLPRQSQGQLGLLSDLYPGITCTLSGSKGEPRFSLEVEVSGSVVQTGGHRHIGPGLVEDLAERLESQLGYRIY